MITLLLVLVVVLLAVQAYEPAKRIKQDYENWKHNQEVAKLHLDSKLQAEAEMAKERARKCTKY